ncbi:hypothetical protein ES705_28344 [subsurface metagenome]
MADILYEHYEQYPQLGETTSISTWLAQGFTPSVAHKVKKVGLVLRQKGATGTFTISIRAADGAGKPTGGDLDAVSFDVSELPVGVLDWVEKYLPGGVDVSDGVTYCIVFRATTTFYYGRDISGEYPNGIASYSENSGVSWTTQPSYDYAFREYGSTYPPVLSSVRLTASFKSATMVANLTDKGGYAVTKRGVAYNTSGGDPHPDTDSKVEETGNFDLGQFTEVIPDLLPETLYYARPYAYSVEEGYGFGTTMTITTSVKGIVIATLNSRFFGFPANVTFGAMRAGEWVHVFAPDETTPDNICGVDDTMTASPWLFRSFLYFDLAGVQNNFPFTTVALKLWSYAVGSDFEKLIITEGIQDFEIPTVANWIAQNSVTTKLAELARAYIVTGEYVTIPFNPDEVAFIKSKVGTYLKLCLMTKDDFENNYSGVVHDGYYHVYLPHEAGKEPYLEFDSLKQGSIISQDIFTRSRQGSRDVFP